MFRELRNGLLVSKELVGSLWEELKAMSKEGRPSAKPGIKVCNFLRVALRRNY